MVDFLIIFIATPLMCVVYGTFAEHWLHKNVMHKRHWLYPYAYVAHAKVHHDVFKADDSYHLGDRGPEVAEKICMAWWNGFVIVGIATILVPAPIAWALYGIFTFKFFLQCGVCVVVFSLHFSAYEYFHFCMHKPANRWFETKDWFLNLKAYHLVHHLHTWANFNTVVLWADRALGTFLKKAKRPFKQVGGPTVRDVQP